MTRAEELKSQAEWIENHKVTVIPPVVSGAKDYVRFKKKKRRAKGKYK